MSPSTPTIRKPSPFRPESSPMKGDAKDLLRIITISIALLILLIPISMSGEPTYSIVNEPVLETHANPAQGGNLIHFSLPEDFMKIAAGSLLGYNGFAYVSDLADKAYFVDLIQDVYLERDIPSGDAVNSQLLTVDYDNDGHDEFVLPNDVGGVDYVVIVDFNDDETLVVQIPGDIPIPAFRGVGDFNGDFNKDLLICDNGYHRYYTIDLYNNATIGSFNTDWGVFAAIGRFESSTHDSIAVITRYYYSFPSYYNHRNITIVDGDGTWLRDTMLPFSVSDITAFEYLAGVDDLAIIDSSGYVSVYLGNTLGQLYRQPVVTTTISAIYIDTGQFNADGQEDIVLQDRNSEKAFLVNGATGSVISEIDEVFVGISRKLDVGYLDQDSYTDLAVAHTSGGLALIRGVDGVMAHIENLIDLRDYGTTQILTFDANSNGRDDTFCRIASDVYLLISDVTPPGTVVRPIAPIHPSVLDDYVKVEVELNESSTMDTADIFVRKNGTTTWTQPQDEMFSSHDGGFYYAFIGNLEQGTYEYYMEFTDAYLNIGSAGTDTNPLTFDVTGDYVWYEDKSENTFYRHGGHYGDVGNESDGSKVIYTVENIATTNNLLISKYSADGVVLDSFVLVLSKVTEYALYTAMLDGDNVTDIIVFDYYYSGGPIPGYHVYHGSDLSLMGQGVAPAFKSFNFIGVFNDDNDNREELYIIADSQDTVIKMESDLTWTSQALEDPGILGYRGFSVVDSGSGAYIAILRGNTRIDLHSADDLLFSHSLDVELSAFSSQEVIGIEPYYNSTRGAEQMVVAYNYWNGTNPTARFYIFDDTTANVNNTPEYTIPGRDVVTLFPIDASGDATDELFVLLSNGESLAASMTSSINPIWITPITGATPLSLLTSDFDGDMRNELLVFTDQDERLTVLSMTGEIERTIQVGEVHYPFEVGNIDLGPGTEIGAFPITTPTTTAIGIIRDLDRYYDLSVLAEYALADIVQGDSFDVNVTVLNVYGETISDATVYMSAHFLSPEGPASNTFGFYFDWPANKYRASTDATWSIGIANLSIFIEHDFYHTFAKLYIDAITVRSDLHISVQIPDLVNQGDSMIVEVLVQDNLGSPIRGASVSVSVEGAPQTATQSGPYYVVVIPEIDLEAGNHNVSAVATHTYGTGVGVDEETFTAQIITTDLLVDTDFPAVINQDDPVSAWFNITDPYGNPITDAMVSLRSGPEGFPLIESTIVPGSYRFNHNVTLGLGNHTFDLQVNKDFLFGPAAAQVQFDVLGDLKPNVFYETRVEGGSMFNIHVFVRDQYGPIFTGTSVSIIINGTVYMQAHTDGNPDYNFLVPADFLMGLNNFTANVSATYANLWSDEFHIRAYSDAESSVTIFPESDWVVLQGQRTEVKVLLDDWLGRPVSGASITIYVRALSYNLHSMGPGVYAANITTIGWAPGEYRYTVSVNHEDIETGVPIQGNITILGSLTLKISYNPTTPTQGESLWISILAFDAYGNPVPDLEIAVNGLNMPMMIAEASEHVGEYIIFIEYLPLEEEYGLKNISIQVAGEFVVPKEMSDSFTLAVAVPSFGQLNVETVTSFTGLSFIISLLGMFVYFKLAPTLRRTGSSKDEMKKSVKRMDRLYLLIVLVSAAGLVGSFGLYSGGEYGGALILTVVLLGSSVLLYGLWLYRDAISAVMVTGKLNRKRMIAGLWHLIFVPLVIVLILTYGTEIQWFKAYMIDNTFVIGDLHIPVIMTTIFTAYLSSILVVVVNLYREVSNGLKKLKKMEDAHTPESVMEDERDTMMNRYSSSIRIKFLMFLVVVGAAAVTTMDFLQSYDIGVIVLMPVAFLVVIPFISSKIVKVFNQATSIRIRKSDSIIDSTSYDDATEDLDTGDEIESSED